MQVAACSCATLHPPDSHSCPDAHLGGRDEVQQHLLGGAPASTKAGGQVDGAEFVAAPERVEVVVGDGLARPRPRRVRTAGQRSRNLLGVERRQTPQAS